MKYISLLFTFLPFFLISCSDSKDESKSQEEMLVGYWAITHTQTIEHVGGGHNTIDKDVPAHGLDSYTGEENYRWDVLIFDDDFVTVRGDMPSKPKSSQFDLNTPEGQMEYLNALENWETGIGDITDQTASPVGKYSINSGNLIIGSLNMGHINFITDNEFTLEYRYVISNTDYIQYVYTYSRIFSLTL